MSRRLPRVAALVLCALPVALAAQAASTTLVAPAQRALAAREKMMQADATAADVDAFLALTTDGLVYEDPVVKMRIEGKAQIREGLIAFLGATRKAKIVVTGRIASPNVVVLEQTVSFEVRQDDGTWKPLTRDQVTIFEFEGDRIRRIADYWAR